uniref:Putative leucine-rich repeat-containing protein n=1 Tax=Corethrella appendiculata TaxID=1370023 RepID=U5EM88_9DIPT
MKNWISCLTVLCVICTVTAQRDVSLEIRDAIISLVHSYSLLDNKLERHELREKSLGELVKKGLITLQKNQRIFEPIRGTLERLEERVSNIETVLLAQEEKFSLQQIKLAEALEGVLKWMNEHSRSFDGSSRMDADDSKEDDDGSLAKKVDDLADSIKSLRREVAEYKNDKFTSEETNKNLLAQTEKLVNSKLASADEVIGKLEEKLSQFYITSPVVAPNRNSEWEENIVQSINEIKENINSVKQNGGSGGVSIDKEFIHGLTNETLEAISDLKLEVLTASDKSFTKTSTRIKETNEALETAINEVLKTVTEEATASETFYSEAQKEFDQIRENITRLSKLEEVLLQTGENVLETKRRIEFGNLQTVLEVGNVVKGNSKDLNSTINKRFDIIDTTILNNHHGALANLSSKIETEISQVWRQIGIMYQEISSSKQALDRLQQQTESYVNGTLTTMDSMEGKVSLITHGMAEVDSNLNFLLGRLSLVTQEFNQIKLGLGDALDNIRSSFLTVQEKIKVGPGPHGIDENKL